MNNTTDFNRTIHLIGDKHFDESEANVPNSLQDWAWGILLSFSNGFGFQIYFFTTKLFSSLVFTSSHSHHEYGNCTPEKVYSSLKRNTF